MLHIHRIGGRGLHHGIVVASLRWHALLRLHEPSPQVGPMRAQSSTLSFLARGRCRRRTILSLTNRTGVALMPCPLHEAKEMLENSSVSGLRGGHVMALRWCGQPAPAR